MPQIDRRTTEWMWSGRGSDYVITHGPNPSFIHFPGHTDAGVSNALLASLAPKMLNLLIELVAQPTNRELLIEAEELVLYVVKEHIK